MNGIEYKNLFMAGYSLLKTNCALVNDLNVFPIPDGDTGDNMCSTLLGGISAIENEESNDLSQVSKTVAHGMLLGARGNSGVILSQIFAGINKGLENIQTATVEDIKNALKLGVTASYTAVDKPSEGTILTVYREAVEAVENKPFKDAEGLFAAFVSAAEISLEDTPNKLACLKEAGVVDSGGKGLCLIFRGFLACLRGENIQSELVVTEEKTANGVDLSKFNEDTVMKFGYCTEFLLQLTNAKTDIAKFSLEKYKRGLQGLGDSLVAFITGSVVKTHIHSFNPDRILAYALSFGELLTIKIENMTLQHNETIAIEAPSKYAKNTQRKKIAVVTVATGNGLKQIFEGFGADAVIYGGQGNNPSTEDFLEAYDAVNADDILVLPNNGNIYLVAKASAEIYQGSNIHVINCKSIGEGYSALSMYDPAESVEDISSQMLEIIENTVSGMVSVATRDACVDGIEIKVGQYVGFSQKHILSVGVNKLDAAMALLDKLNIKEKYILTAIYGKDITNEEKQKFEAEIASKYPDIEFYGIDGEQDVYDFVFVL